MRVQGTKGTQSLHELGTVEKRKTEEDDPNIHQTHEQGGNVRGELRTLCSILWTGCVHLISLKMGISLATEQGFLPFQS